MTIQHTGISNETIELHGNVVTLREFTPDDAADSLCVVGDERVTRFLSFDSRNLEQARSMISGAIERRELNPRSEYYLAITKSDNDKLIGFARLGLSGVKAAKLGYAIAVDHWGNGYATDAACAMVTFGFDQLGLHRVTAAIGPENTASMTVVTRLGFTKEGVLRDHVFTNGAWRDSVLYSVLEPEWRHRKPS